MNAGCDACGHGGEHHLWSTCWSFCYVENVPFGDGRGIRGFCGCPGYEPSEGEA